MNVDERPKGLTATAIFMSITNAMGWAIIDWSKPHARTIFVMFTVLIATGYVVIWFYWKGKTGHGYSFFSHLCFACTTCDCGITAESQNVS
jgi:hypothetical protein